MPATKAKHGAHDLIERLQAVGWDHKPIGQNGEALRFVTPGGKELIVQEQYETLRALHNAENLAVKLGLLEAERVQEEAKAQLRRLKAQQAMEGARLEQEERDGETLTEEEFTARLHEIRDYYSPENYNCDIEVVPLEWFIAKHERMQTRTVWMTVPIAQHLLEHHNVSGAAGVIGTNRPLQEREVEHVRNVIASKQFRLTHQGMAMDTDGNVQDAQHRMSALVQLGELIPDLRIPTQFTVGCPPENFLAVDAGRVKTAAQLLTKLGEANGKVLQGASRLISAYRSGNLWHAMRDRPTSEDVIGTFKTSPELLREGGILGNRYRNKIPMAPSSFAAGYALICEANGRDNVYVQAFFDGLVKGYKERNSMILAATDPRRVLREEMARARDRKQRISGPDQFGMLLVTWNAVASGIHPANRVKWKKGESEFPQVLICRDTVSKTPRALLGEVG